MPDYEIWAPDDAAMRTVLASSAFANNSGRRGGTTYAVDYYGTKYVQVGTVRMTSPMGVTSAEPNWVAQPGVYANVRWMGATAIPLIPGTTGATVTLLTAPYFRTFA